MKILDYIILPILIVFIIYFLLSLGSNTLSSSYNINYASSEISKYTLLTTTNFEFLEETCNNKEYDLPFLKIKKMVF